MVKFHGSYLTKGWGEVTCIELLAMVQNTNVFWDFAVQIQLKNTFLHNTPSHLTKEQVCHCIKASMNLKLTLHCCSWN
jgi:hypothetical protein